MCFTTCQFCIRLRLPVVFLQFACIPWRNMSSEGTFRGVNRGWLQEASTPTEIALNSAFFKEIRKLINNQYICLKNNEAPRKKFSKFWQLYFILGRGNLPIDLGMPLIFTDFQQCTWLRPTSCWKYWKNSNIGRLCWNFSSRKCVWGNDLTFFWNATYMT